MVQRLVDHVAGLKVGDLSPHLSCAGVVNLKTTVASHPGAVDQPVRLEETGVCKRCQGGLGGGFGFHVHGGGFQVGMAQENYAPKKCFLGAEHAISTGLLR